ncbi:GntR family transcriptional regulator [uncultured Mitsuokella sp.]|uniref:GntR family transcriptional regulator n=1 Tax=uncultured Mitsuokella sp. TaxID=453120 RepID=UPI0025DB57DC|nr:GntR family transcriptional regulator [uncultured Mitsuokella sp.]
MDQRLTPIKLDSYQPLREVVCESLRDAIRKGILKPGQRIMEIKLAEELGVSRTPVREAIRKLELEGYVVMMPRRGTYVADMSIRDINEIFEIRTALESLSNGLAAEHITEDELEHLQRLLVVIGGYIKEYEDGPDREAAMDKIVKTDIEFHDLLYHAARNNRLVGIISNLRDQLTRFRTLSMSYPGRLEATLDEHREIVETIANGDGRAARKAAVHHMENSEKTLLKAMDIAINQKAEAKTAKKKKARSPKVNA